MTWLELLQEIFQVCILPLLGVLTTFLIKYIQNKSNEVTVAMDNELTEKYVKLLTTTITDCVKATNQTYVDALKDKNAFSKEAQEEAFKKTSDAVMTILSDDAKLYLDSLYGDLNQYIITQIEASVSKEKKPSNE